jgi:hypothetical protein
MFIDVLGGMSVNMYHTAWHQIPNKVVFSHVYIIFLNVVKSVLRLENFREIALPNIGGP